MKLKETFFINAPAKNVFVAFRDKTLDFAKHIPNVSDVEVITKEKIDSKTIRLVSRWEGHGDIPWAVRSIVFPHMITWEEEDVFDEKNLTCTWQCTPKYFTDYFTCKGQWLFEEDGPRASRVALSGLLKVDIPSFPGVPDRVARSAGKIIEEFIYKYLKPNLATTIEAIEKLLKKSA